MCDGLKFLGEANPWLEIMLFSVPIEEVVSHFPDHYSQQERILCHKTHYAFTYVHTHPYTHKPSLQSK